MFFKEIDEKKLGYLDRIEVNKMRLVLNFFENLSDLQEDLEKCEPGRNIILELSKELRRHFKGEPQSTILQILYSLERQSLGHLCHKVSENIHDYIFYKEDGDVESLIPDVYECFIED